MRGRVRWCLLIDGSEAAADALTTGVFELDGDGWIGRHRHTAPEVYYVLAGEAVVTLESEEITVSPGAIVRLPADVEHAIRALGRPVRMLFVFPSAAFVEVVYRFSHDVT